MRERSYVALRSMRQSHHDRGNHQHSYYDPNFQAAPDHSQRKEQPSRWIYYRQHEKCRNEQPEDRYHFVPFGTEEDPDQLLREDKEKRRNWHDHAQDDLEPF